MLRNMPIVCEIKTSDSSTFRSPKGLGGCIRGVQEPYYGLGAQHRGRQSLPVSADYKGPSVQEPDPSEYSYFSLKKSQVH